MDKLKKEDMDQIMNEFRELNMSFTSSHQAVMEVVSPEHPDTTYCSNSYIKNCGFPLSSSTPNVTPKSSLITGTSGSVKKFKKQCEPKTPLKKKTVGETNQPSDVKETPPCLIMSAYKQPSMTEKRKVFSSCENVMTNKKDSEQCVDAPVKKDQNVTSRKKEESAIEGVKRIGKENAEGQQNTRESDNYNIDDLESGDSTDDDTMPKKVIPRWAEKQSRSQCAEVEEHVPGDLCNDRFYTEKDQNCPTESRIFDNSNLTAAPSSNYSDFFSAED